MRGNRAAAKGGGKGPWTTPDGCFVGSGKLAPEDARVLAWFLTGLRHETIRLARKHRRVQGYELLILNGPVDQDLSGELSMLDTIAATVDVSGEAEVSVLIQNALSLLTPQQQEVITATVLEGITEQATAVRLGITQQAVHKVKDRALSTLRKYFVLDESSGK